MNQADNTGMSIMMLSQKVSTQWSLALIFLLLLSCDCTMIFWTFHIAKCLFFHASVCDHVQWPCPELNLYDDTHLLWYQYFADISVQPMWTVLPVPAIFCHSLCLEPLMFCTSEPQRASRMATHLGDCSAYSKNKQFLLAVKLIAFHIISLSTLWGSLIVTLHSCILHRASMTCF